MVGGSFVPLDALPEWIANIGRLAPNGFIVDRLSGELTSATAWSIDTQSWATMFAMLFSGLALGMWRLGTGFARN